MSDLRLPPLNEWERNQLAKRECPYSGSRVYPRQYFDGPIERDLPPRVYACSICDCFGFDPDEVTTP